MVWRRECSLCTAGGDCGDQRRCCRGCGKCPGGAGLDASEGREELGGILRETRVQAAEGVHLREVVRVKPHERQVEAVELDECANGHLCFGPRSHRADDGSRVGHHRDWHSSGEARPMVANGPADASQLEEGSTVMVCSRRVRLGRGSNDTPFGSADANDTSRKSFGDGVDAGAKRRWLGESVEEQGA